MLTVSSRDPTNLRCMGCVGEIEEAGKLGCRKKFSVCDEIVSGNATANGQRKVFQMVQASTAKLPEP